MLDSVHAEVTGPETGAPVLLLHGWGSSAQLMRPIAEALNDTFRVHNVDLPGHGQTPAPPEAWGVPEYAALVQAYVSRYMDAPVTLVGHSNGGRIGLYMSSEPAYEGTFSRLVLVSPSGITPPRPASYYIKTAVAKTLKAPFVWMPEPARSTGLQWVRGTLPWQLLGSSDYSALDGVMRETFVKTVTFHVDGQVGRITLPTLLFWGDQDTAVSRKQMDTLEQAIDGAGLVVLEGAGHYGYLDAAPVFNAAVRHFLETEKHAAEPDQL